MPYKLILVDKRTGKKYMFYKSTTINISYSKNKYEAHIQNTKEQKSKQSQKQLFYTK